MTEKALTVVLTEALTRQPGLELAILFGSVARGAEGLDSDVDVAVQAAAPLDAPFRMTLVAALADATGRAIDLVDLRTVGEPLLCQILKHGVRLLGSDEALARLLSRHLIDAAPVRLQSSSRDGAGRSATSCWRSFPTTRSHSGGSSSQEGGPCGPRPWRLAGRTRIKPDHRVTAPRPASRRRAPG